MLKNAVVIALLSSLALPAMAQQAPDQATAECIQALKTLNKITTTTTEYGKAQAVDNQLIQLTNQPHVTYKEIGLTNYLALRLLEARSRLDQLVGLAEADTNRPGDWRTSVKALKAKLSIFEPEFVQACLPS